MSGNFFEIFELPKKLNIDHNLLKKKFVVLTKKFSGERGKQMDLIEKAYNTLKERLPRIDYLLESEGHKVSKDRKKTPTSLSTLSDLIDEVIPLAKKGSKEATSKLKKAHQDIIKEFSSVSIRLSTLEKEWDENQNNEKTESILRKLKKTSEDFHFVRKLERAVREFLE